MTYFLLSIIGILLILIYIQEVRYNTICRDNIRLRDANHNLQDELFHSERTFGESNG